MPTGMTEVALYAWRNAERNVFDHIISETGDVENTSAWLAELPKDAPSIADLAGWSFAITGIAEPESSPRPYWRFTATLDGFFSERIEAQRLAGKIMELCPIRSGTVDGIELVRVLGCELRRGTRSIDEDLSQGGEMRVWFLEMQLQIDALNTAPEV